MKIKNIAIIAHVDHGKTTLIDAMLRQSGVFRENENVEERVLDSNDLEREKGITIFSKIASISYKDCKINIVDTPGHADFGGEVQRILKMVDSVLLLVDAFEGTMAQTKYVLKNALHIGHKPIVVINKCDRPNSNPDEVVNQVFDLFDELNATDEQLDFPVIFASAKHGTATEDLANPSATLIPLFNRILEHVEDSKGDRDLPFQMLVSATDYDNYLGKLCTGKVNNGKLRSGDEIHLMKKNEDPKLYKVTRVFSYSGLGKEVQKEIYAGDIVTIAGIEKVDVGDTVNEKDFLERLESIDIDEPTLSMTFSVNSSPFAGKEGKFVTSRHVFGRLEKEILANVSLQLEEADSPDSMIVKARGELQLSILIENMRREGFEFAVSRPHVIYKEKDGQKLEPIKLAIIDVSEEFSGAVIEMLGSRKGELINMLPGNDGYTRMEFKIPARGLIGFHSDFLTNTRGTGILNHSFLGYEPYKGDMNENRRGSLISMQGGVAMAYSLYTLQQRGDFFITPGTEVYEGMVVGENVKTNDLIVNVCRNKQLTNFRASGSDDSIRLNSPRIFSLEQALEYTKEDELLEITPKSIRMRKKVLNENDRKRSQKVTDVKVS